MSWNAAERDTFAMEPMRAATDGDTPLTLDDRELDLLGRGVRIIALRALGDPDAAWDIVQETLARALHAVREGRLRDRTRLGAFVRGIARHVITDELRRRGRFAGSDGELPEVAHQRDGGGDRDALDGLVRAEEAMALRAALSELSRSDQDIIRLTFVDGLTPGQVAQRLRQPAERVRKRKSRALERLREIFLAARDRHGSRLAPTLSTADQRAARAAGEHGD